MIWNRSCNEGVPIERPDLVFGTEAQNMGNVRGGISRQEGVVSYITRENTSGCQTDKG